jgi:hypothetical protein
MIKVRPKSYLSILFLLCFFLQLGAIRREDDGVLKAQTDPISLNKKMEEIKDGVKGAPTPSFEFYKKESFMTQNPMDMARETTVKPSANPLDTVSEVNLEETASNDTSPSAVASKEKETAEPDADSWWVEDSPQEDSKSDVNR